MTRIIKLFLAISLFLFVLACEKEEDNHEWQTTIWEPSSQEFGSGMATKNGQGWTAGGYALLDAQDSTYGAIYLNTATIEGFHRERIIIGLFPLTPFAETYRLVNDNTDAVYSQVIARYHVMEDDGDVAGGSAILDMNQASFISVSYNSRDQTVEGSFELHFVHETNSKLNIDLEGGSFKFELL